jgi:epoxyqueuosine reductase
VLATAYVDELSAVGMEAGLDAVGVAPAAPFASVRAELERRRDAGLHGGMAFTYRRPARSTDPSATVAGARSLVVGARSYRRGRPGPRPTGPAGRVARYAWDDTYAPLRAALDAVAQRLERDGWQARVVADDNALVDREAAYRAGLGWYGKNANVLLPGRGSWFVLGSVITDASLPPSPAPVQDGCGSCTRCIDACPTGAIVAPGVVDARRCLAWLVQAPGDFPLEHREALGDRMYGCDDCQEVCPPNRRADRADRTEPETSDSPGQPWVPLLWVLGASDEELLERCGRWYIPQRDPRYLRRNALVALGNAGDPTDTAVRATVDRYLSDPDPMLRRHAEWAAMRLR